MSRIINLQFVEKVVKPAIDSVTVSGTTGSSTYTYKLVCAGNDAALTEASDGYSVTNGYAVLNATHTNTIVWTDPAEITEIYVYRTATDGSPATVGLIGTVAPGVQTFIDNGIAGDTTVPGTVNHTGYSPVYDVSSLTNKYIQVSGTFSATLVLQGSIDNVVFEDGYGANVTSAGIYSIPKTYAFVRVFCSSYTSGSARITLLGQGTTV